MKWIYSLEKCSHESVSLLGGKAVALARLHQAGMVVPRAACLTTAAYEHFLEVNGLREKLQLELSRKDFSDMRWEEIWDTSLRIRHLFLTTPFPEDFEDEICGYFRSEFGGMPLAVRSSAPDEDQSGSSFAGLHDSYLNIRGSEQLLLHIRKVWASLWSDKALLYRQELKLSVSSSSMAVVVQELVHSDAAGVGFSQDPLDDSRMVIEAVYGLNQGLVDGDIEPDRWLIDRKSHKVIEHAPSSERSRMVIADEQGVDFRKLNPDLIHRPPVSEGQLSLLVKSMVTLEDFFGHPVDMEWTWADETFYILQARPITAAATGDNKDQRSWYLSLHRSYTNLLTLWDTIENSMLPAMENEAALMAGCDLKSMSNAQLARETRHRFERASHWSKVYWDDCIPFAHGVRLFGEIYNDLMAPDDPYQFVGLLSGERMLSTLRNSVLQQLAARVRTSQKLRDQLESEGYSAVTDEQFRSEFIDLENRFGNFFTGQGEGEQDREDLIVKVILEYSRITEREPEEGAATRQELEESFILQLSNMKTDFNAEELLGLGRASYRLRDDDNIYLGKIEQQLAQAVDEGRKRLVAMGDSLLHLATPEEIARLLSGEVVKLSEPSRKKNREKARSLSLVRARQLTGQPASHGVARGRARVILKALEMADFQVGEVLVVESIDPNMTFLAPLAAAIVERRGGMLIHGAIIAREYGIPCVTGVSEVTGYIDTGDTVTVDGYLGIVTVDKS